MGRITSCLALATAFVGGDGVGKPASHMSANLVAQTSNPRPGSSVLLGFEMAPEPGWHGYWKNPGDSGIPPSVAWSAPPGIGLGPLLHPAPVLLVADGMTMFVHPGPHILLSRMQVARSVKPGTRIPIRADLSWAACTETQCVPMHKSFALDLVAGDGSPGPQAGVLRAAYESLPKSAADGNFSVTDGRLLLSFPKEAHLRPRTTTLFPDEAGVLAVPQEESALKDGRIVMTAPLATSAALRSLSGVASDGTAAYRVVFKRSRVAATRPAARSKNASASPAIKPFKRASPAKANPRRRQPADRPSSRRDSTHWLIWIVVPAALLAALCFVLCKRPRQES